MNYFDILFAKYKFEKDHPTIIKRTTGNPIVLTDAADAPLVECKTEIQGSQDLHGYDKPWVGGAGKNKCPNKAYKANSYTLYVGQDDNTSFPFALVGGTTYTLSFVSELSPILIYLREENTASGTLVNNTFTPSASGNYRIAISIDGIDTTNVSNIQLELGSSATDYEPYSNICPITAYTEGEIEVRGKNIFGTSVSSGYTLTSLGVIESDPTRSATLEYTSIQGNIDYALSYVGNMNNGVFFYDENKDFISFLALGSTPRTFKSPSNAAYVRFSFNSATVPVNMMLEKGETATAYEPYTSTTHTTTYPSSIYRGSEDCVKGEVTKEWGIVDLGSLTWTYSEGTQQFRSSRIADIKEPDDTHVVPDAICEIYEAKRYFGLNNYDSVFTVIFATSNDHGKIYVKDSRYTDATAFASAVSGVKLAYKLATPTTSSVTPTNLPIKSLSGYNHIESSTGELDITYLTQNYQNFVDIIENNLATRKGGIKPLDVFRTLEVNKVPEEEEKKDEKVEDVKK